MVFDSPHSGTIYPDDFRPKAPMAVLRASEDSYVDELFADAPTHGAVLIAADFPRVYIDPNRHEDDVDPDLLSERWPDALAPSKKQALGKSLIWRLIGDGTAIYHQPLTLTEVRDRIEGYWRPYHDCLADALHELHTDFGQVWHVNCHSMQAVGTTLSPDPGRRRADFTISDRNGETCDPAFLECVVETLGNLGYEARVNDPYQGMELIRRYSEPDAGRHSLQIEINRALYMEERTREKREGFAQLRENLARLAQAVSAFARQSNV